jgi:hypothetical protein
MSDNMNQQATLLSGFLRKRIIFRRARTKAAEMLVASGFSSVGGDAKPLTQDQADHLVGLIDDQSLEHSTQHISFGSGAFVQDIQDFIQWVKDHKAILEEIAKVILSIALML